MRRYAAILVFCFRVKQPQSKMFFSEERTVTFQAKNADAALSIATKKGKAKEYDYLNSFDQQVRFVFIGIKNLRRLDLLCEQDEVWYEIKQHRKLTQKKLIPPVSALEAMKEEIQIKKSSKRLAN